MRTEIARIEDANGTMWRLVIDDFVPEALIVDRRHVALECRYSTDDSGWALVDKIDGAQPEFGIEWRGRGVLILDPKKTRATLVGLMAKHGLAPAIAGEPPWSKAPNIPEPTLERHRRVNLLEFLVQVEAAGAGATPGIWYAADGRGRSLKAVMNAVMSGGPGDPVCESMTAQDVEHAIATQPLSSGALVRKLREAYFLLQDLSKAALALRGEIDHLSSPQHRTPQYLIRIDMFDRWMSALSERCAAFPTIQVPEFSRPGPLAAQAPPPQILEPDDMREIARAEALRQGALGEHDYLPTTPEQAAQFVVHDWVLWAMAAAVHIALTESSP